MATRSTSKSTLKSSTALPVSTKDKATPPRKDDNILPFVTAETKRINTLVVAAFKEDDEANATKGKAQQRITAAILMQYALWVDSGHDDYRNETDGTDQMDKFPSLSHAFHDAKVRATLAGMFRKAFLPLIGVNLEPDEKVAQELERAAHGTLINTGIKLAALLYARGITVESYKDNMFKVPTDMFLRKGQKWNGSLNLPGAAKTIALNGNGFSATENIGTDANPKDKAIKIKASVTSLFAAAMIRKPGPGASDTASKKGDGIDWTKFDPTNSTCPIKTMIKLLRHALYKDGGNEVVPLSDVENELNSEDWTDLSDIAMASDTLQHTKGWDKFKKDNKEGRKSA